MNKKIVGLGVVLFLVIIVNSMPCLAQGSDFKPSYQINRVKAATHYFFSLFEKNPRDADAIVAVLSAGSFELKYPWGEFRTQAEVRKWVREIPNDFHDAHHIQDIQIEIIDDRNAKAIVDIIWQNTGPNREFSTDRFLYNIEFRQERAMLPKIKKLRCQRLKSD